MNLLNFERHIDKKIVDRGYDYYENHYVTLVEKTGKNVYEAEVAGSELYTVEVELSDQGAIVDSRCDCPYDWGEYCKHQTAVFFALRNIKNGTGLDKKDGESLHQSAAPRKRKAPDMKKILSGRTKDELVEFLLAIAGDYEEIKRQIVLRFNDENDDEEISQSIMLIRTFIKKNSDRRGFVAYGDTQAAVKGADLVLEKARYALAKNKTKHALELALCVIHEMMDFLESADDSGGVVGGEIAESLAFLRELVENKGLSLTENAIVFQKLIEEAVHSRYDGWTDWRLELLESCSELAYIPDLRNKLDNHLAAIVKSGKEDSWIDNYLAEKVNLIRHRMIEKFDGQQKAREFIEQNLHHSEFRKMAIENAMKEKDYDLVITLTLDGQEKDKNSPGLVNQWKQYRYKAFQLTGKLDDLREIALEFILDGSYEYYKELKKTYTSKEWLSVYPKIISLLENQKKSYRYDIYTRILIEEGEKQKLLAYVKARPSTVEDFYKQLMPEFKDEVYALFLQYIEQAAAGASDRRGYQGVCAIIRNLKKAGGQEQALEIKEKLLNKYPNRPAFRDELSKVR